MSDILTLIDHITKLKTSPIEKSNLFISEVFASELPKQSPQFLESLIEICNQNLYSLNKALYVQESLLEKVKPNNECTVHDLKITLNDALGVRIDVINNLDSMYKFVNTVSNKVIQDHIKSANFNPRKIYD